MSEFQDLWSLSYTNSSKIHLWHLIQQVIFSSKIHLWHLIQQVILWFCVRSRRLMVTFLYKFVKNQLMALYLVSEVDLIFKIFCLDSVKTCEPQYNLILSICSSKQHQKFDPLPPQHSLPHPHIRTSSSIPIFIWYHE